MPSLFCFGLGYSAQHFARLLDKNVWTVGGTAQSSSGLMRIQSLGYEGYIFDGTSDNSDIDTAIQKATHILISIPPDTEGDPTLKIHKKSIARSNVEWIGYLSTIGVYGDHSGRWIDEETPVEPLSDRSRRRTKAEYTWLEFGAENNKRVEIFRLAGIYGPRRNILQDLREGSAISIIKQGQVFNRIHVEDIAQTLLASLSVRSQYNIYNVTDNEPAPPQEVNSYAAQLLGLSPPPEIPLEKAQLSDMARSFYSENKRVKNERIKKFLGVKLIFPSYREGLTALARET